MKVTTSGLIGGLFEASRLRHPGLVPGQCWTKRRALRASSSRAWNTPPTGPHGHRVTLTAAPSIPRGTPRGMRSPGPDPGPHASWFCLNRKEPRRICDRPPGHDRQCSALSGRWGNHARRVQHRMAAHI